MKKILYPIVLAVLFTACGEKLSPLEEAKQQKEKLNSKIGALRTEVRDLDEIIRELDVNAVDKRVAVSVQKIVKSDFTA